MNAITIMIGSICLLALAYRFYSLFFANKILRLRNDTPTPAELLDDGQDYVPTNKWVAFGHHFAAIAAAGPLVGPVLAAQFGYLPGLLWLLIGAVLGGAVHDAVVLYASMRHQGQSLSEVAKKEMGPLAGFCAGLAMLFIITITMAGLSMVVLNALTHNPWGTFTIAMTIPIAMAVGLFYRFTGQLKLASTVGFTCILAAVGVGPWVQSTVLGTWLSLDYHTLALILPVYAFFAAALPVWLLLTPRDYLSSFMKIGVFLALIIGVFVINPAIRMPALTEFTSGGGPVIAGPVWPFISITIACGAISGFHAFVGSGTTPKIIKHWRDIRMVASGAMLVECLVAIMALLAATALHPADYFAINATPEVFRSLGMTVVDLPKLSHEIGIDLAGRTGGAVTLAVGMTAIFTRFPFFATMAPYFYQFVILFEAVFILTAIDAGTRVARYLIQDFFGELYKPLKQVNWLPGTIFASVLACFAWGYLLYSGDISSIWVLFGVSNQLMAVIGLIVGAIVILKMASNKHYWLTCLIPLAYLYVTVNTASFWMMKHVYFNPAHAGFSIVNGTVSLIMLVLAVIILVTALKQWRHLWQQRRTPLGIEGEPLATSKNTLL